MERVRDRTIQWSLGIFVATFVYAMTVIRTILGSADGPFVPRIAVTVAFLLVLGSVGVFIVYINHIANMIRVSSIITSIGEQSSACSSAAGPPSHPRSHRLRSCPARRRWSRTGGRGWWCRSTRRRSPSMRLART